MQVESVRENNGTMYVNVRSLQEDEQHRWGEIRMSCNQGEVSIRSIAKEHQKREGLTISLSAAKLGDPTAGGFQQCSELAKYLARGHPVAQQKAKSSVDWKYVKSKVLAELEKQSPRP